MTVKARIYITLKNGVLDPQGKAIEGGLAALGFTGVQTVRQGEVIDIELAAQDRDAARAQIESMCEQLLANTVIEQYNVEMR